MNTDVNMFENSYNDYLEKQVNSTLSAIVGNKFKAIQHSGGFNYMTKTGRNYNYRSLQCLDSLLAATSGKQPDLNEGSFANYYKELLQNTEYVLSQQTAKNIEDSIIKCTAQINAVIDAYDDTDLPKLKSTKQTAMLAEIYRNCAIAFGAEIDKDCSVIPNSYYSLKMAMQKLNNMQYSSLKFVLLQGNKNAELSEIIDHIENPSAENGGLPTNNDSEPYYVGYTVPDEAALVNSLNTKDRAITVNVSGEMQNSKSMDLSVDNKTAFPIPIAAVLDINVGHKSAFDMTKLTRNDTDFSASITYTGITDVAVRPDAESTTGKTGWYNETILNEIRTKTKDKNVDGFKLTGSEFNVDKVFGNELAQLKTMIISKTPNITITFRNVDMDYAEKNLRVNNNVDITLFGFIHLGSHNSSYEQSDIKFDRKTNSVTMTFCEPDAGVSPDINKVSAFIMGGVPHYPGME